MTISEINKNLRSNPDYYQIAVNKFHFLEMLIPEVAQKLANNKITVGSLTFHDFKEECQEECLLSCKIEKTQDLFKDFLDATFSLKFERSLTKTEKMEFVTADENINFVKNLFDEASRIVNLAVEKFKMGEVPLMAVLLPDTSSIKIGVPYPRKKIEKKEKFLVPIRKLHPKVLERMKLTMLLQPVKPPPLNEKAMRIRAKVLMHQQVKSRALQAMEMEKRCQEYSDLQHYYLFLSSKLHKRLDEILEAEIASSDNENAYEEFKKQKAILLERMRTLDIEQSFQHCKTLTTPPKIKAKKKKKHLHTQPIQEKHIPEKTAAKKEESIVPMLSLLPKKADFFLDKRITRWFDITFTTLDKIREFIDKATTPYLTYSPEKLAEQLRYHCLMGVARLMSHKNLQKYSTTYQIMHNGSLKNGCCFSAELRYGTCKEEGFIYVAIGNVDEDDVDAGEKIYHAKFVPSKKQVVPTSNKPQDLCLPLDECSQGKEKEWEMAGRYAFSIRDGIIIWTIVHLKVEYRILPLVLDEA